MSGKGPKRTREQLQRIRDLRSQIQAAKKEIAEIADAAGINRRSASRCAIGTVKAYDNAPKQRRASDA